MTEPLVVPARYCGPPASGNGGYVAGSLAHHLDRADGHGVTVRLHRPPPLEVAMDVTRVDGTVRLERDGTLVAEARAAEIEVPPVPPVPYDEALAASAAYPGHTFHPFPTCFACGVDRPDGLRIFPGPVAPAASGGTRVAAPWVPDETVAADFQEYDDPARRACLAATWAALDCIGGWAGDLTERLMVLGEMSAVVDALPVLGEPHVVMGEALGSAGRRTMTASSLVDADGRVVGRARHVWIAVDPATFGSPTVR